MSDWRSKQPESVATQNAWSKKGKTWRAKTFSALKDLYGEKTEPAPQKEEGSSKLHWGEPRRVSASAKKRKEAQLNGRDTSEYPY